MKRKIAILLIAAMSVCLAACGTTNEGAEVEHDHDHNQAVEVNLRIGVSAHDGDVEYEAAERFAQIVEAQSDGAVIATVYGDNQLGSDQEILEAIAQGDNQVDIVVADLSDLVTYAPAIDISTMPFLFDSYEDVRTFMNGDIQKEAASGLSQHNMRALAYYSNGFSGLLTSEKMINNPRELQGLTIATSKQTIGTTAMKALGARTVSMDVDGLRQATQQGACDGYEGNIIRIRQERLFQDQKYLVVTNHTYSASGFVIAESVWQGLDAEYQEIIESAAISSANVNLDSVYQSEKQAMSDIESSGVRIQYPNTQSFWEKSESLIRGYASQYGSLVDRLIVWKSEQN